MGPVAPGDHHAAGLRAVRFDGCLHGGVAGLERLPASWAGGRHAGAGHGGPHAAAGPCGIDAGWRRPPRPGACSGQRGPGPRARHPAEPGQAGPTGPRGRPGRRRGAPDGPPCVARRSAPGTLSARRREVIRRGARLEPVAELMGSCLFSTRHRCHPTRPTATSRSWQSLVPEPPMGRTTARLQGTGSLRGVGRRVDLGKAGDAG
mmetsp:Transcript_76729/g.248398  ORF Transcript_76729/g.248398 Transcript_76729/m.248398 type:complete len:205 (+) Transcript_76729:894-1508(+)